MIWYIVLFSILICIVSVLILYVSYKEGFTIRILGLLILLFILTEITRFSIDTSNAIVCTVLVLLCIVLVYRGVK